MREVVVISGKGGTGKTSLTASFAVLAGPDIVLADCDVDAADLHLLLEPDFASSSTFRSGTKAEIDPSRCLDCGECADVCRFQAISHRGGHFVVDVMSCEGCGYCSRVCPGEAIRNPEQEVGSWYRSRTRTGAPMVHAVLGIGADNSGKLVAKVKNEARALAEAEGLDLVLVDGSPGVGCPVVSSLSGASFVVLVTEPTTSGVHDLKRVHELVRRFGIPAGCIVNKADLNQAFLGEIRDYLEREGIALLAELPYDETFTAAITEGRTVVEWDQDLSTSIQHCWDRIQEEIPRR